MKLGGEIKQMVEIFHAGQRKHPFQVLAKLKNHPEPCWEYHENVVNDTGLECLMIHPGEYFHPCISGMELFPTTIPSPLLI